MAYHYTICLLFIISLFGSLILSPQCVWSEQQEELLESKIPTISVVQSSPIPVSNSEKHSDPLRNLEWLEHAAKLWSETVRQNSKQFSLEKQPKSHHISAPPPKLKHNTYFSRWMENIAQQLSNQSLVELFLPGTHEASSYNLTNVASPDEDPRIRKIAKKIGFIYPLVVKPWSEDQKLSTYEQLMRGARFLDWRVSYRAGGAASDSQFVGEYFSAHGLWGNNLDSMLSQLAQFLEETTHEVIMIELSHFFDLNEERYEALQALIEKQVGKYMIRREDFTSHHSQQQLHEAFFETITYQDIMNLPDSNKRLIMFLDPFNSTTLYPSPQYGFFNISRLVIPWADTSDVTGMMNFQGQQIVSQSGEFNLLYGVQFLLTPQPADIAEGVVGEVVPGYNIDSIEKLSRFANVHLDEFMRQWLTTRKVSNMIIDRIEHTSLVDHAIRINARNCNDNPQYRDPLKKPNNCATFKEEGRCSDPKYQSFMRDNCALTCQLCASDPRGFPGDSCSSDDDCKSWNGTQSLCKRSTSTCLIPNPYPVGHTCGADYHCETGYCNTQTNICSGRFIKDRCDTDRDCMYGICSGGICNGTVTYEILGTSPVCRTSEEDCLRHGLLFVAKTIGDANGECRSILTVHGNKMICTNARLPVDKFYWLPCGSSPQDCVHQHSIPIVTNKCGQYDCCSGDDQYVLCGST